MQGEDDGEREDVRMMMDGFSRACGLNPQAAAFVPGSPPQTRDDLSSSLPDAGADQVVYTRARQERRLARVAVWRRVGSSLFVLFNCLSGRAVNILVKYACEN